MYINRVYCVLIALSMTMLACGDDESPIGPTTRPLITSFSLAFSEAELTPDAIATLTATFATVPAGGADLRVELGGATTVESGDYEISGGHSIPTTFTLSLIYGTESVNLFEVTNKNKGPAQKRLSVTGGGSEAIVTLLPPPVSPKPLSVEAWLDSDKEEALPKDDEGMQTGVPVVRGQNVTVYAFADGDAPHVWVVNESVTADADSTRSIVVSVNDQGEVSIAPSDTTSLGKHTVALKVTDANGRKGSIAFLVVVKTVDVEVDFSSTDTDRVRAITNDDGDVTHLEVVVVRGNNPQLPAITLSATGGVGKYEWTLDGSPSDEVAIDQETGQLDGIVGVGVVAGLYEMTATATDENGNYGKLVIKLLVDSNLGE